MSKIKMRCTTCGKWFQSANAKETTCPDCVQKARREKLAARNPQATADKAGGAANPSRPVPLPPRPKPAQSGSSHWFDTVSDVKIGQPDTPPQRPKLPPSLASRDYDREREPEQRGPGGYRDRDERDPGGPGGYHGPGGYRDRDERDPGGPGSPGGYRGPGGYRDRDERGPGNYRQGGTGTIDTGYRPRQPLEGGFGRGPRPGGPGGPRDQRPEGRKGGKPQKAKKPSTPPKPKREKIPPPKPFEPTPEQIAQVETRYAELAVPQEFDGIRTQIAQELSIPKKAVKKIVQEYRVRNSIPSWWETQTYKGDSEELAKIKAAYEPYLPLPPVGVHKKIAEELELKAGDVYQAIKAIRIELNLPQFNDPAVHGEELVAASEQRKKKSAQAAESARPAEPAKSTENAEPVVSEQSSKSEEGATEPAKAEASGNAESVAEAEKVESGQSASKADEAVEPAESAKSALPVPDAFETEVGVPASEGSEGSK